MGTFPACGHSACRQNWIETGETECVDEDGVSGLVTGEPLPAFYDTSLAAGQALMHGLKLVEQALLLVACPVCRTQYTRATFMLLELVGYLGRDLGLDRDRFELRNCPCGNTLSRSLS